MHLETELHSPPDDVDAVHDLLKQVWAGSPQVDPTDRFRFETALVELSGNVFEHADGGQGLHCTLEVTVCTDRLAAVIRDSGVPLVGGFDEPPMPDEFAESGRGLALIHALVDELTYVRENDMNHWQLVRNLNKAPAS